MNTEDFFAQRLPSPLQKLELSWCREAKVELWIKRDDLIHPQVSGNKWRKLKGWLRLFREQGKKEILSCGGAFSNHLVALAAVARMARIPASALVRGDELNENSNEVLQYCHRQGLKLEFIGREAYRKWRLEPPELAEDMLWIPEGGKGAPALEGCAELAAEIPLWTDEVLLACGTGTTCAGISVHFVAQAKPMRICAVSVLQAESWMLRDIEALSGIENSLLEIEHRFHFGGYAQHTPELTEFCENFSSETGIPIEPTYTGKAMFALRERLREGRYPAGSRVVMIHSGGVLRFDGNLD